MPIIVGKVYANWCHHCRDFNPLWAHLKTIPETNHIQFVEFEETEADKRKRFENSTGVNLEVNGFPTIFKIADKNVDYYSGERTQDHMLKWLSHKDSTAIKVKNKKRKNTRSKTTVNKKRKNTRSKKTINRRKTTKKPRFRNI
jgi:thiol-disulfide isomerase/thioredoxin